VRDHPNLTVALAALLGALLLLSSAVFLQFGSDDGRTPADRIVRLLSLFAPVESPGVAPAAVLLALLAAAVVLAPTRWWSPRLPHALSRVALLATVAFAAFTLNGWWRSSLPVPDPRGASSPVLLRAVAVLRVGGAVFLVLALSGTVPFGGRRAARGSPVAGILVLAGLYVSTALTVSGVDRLFGLDAPFDLESVAAAGLPLGWAAVIATPLVLLAAARTAPPRGRFATEGANPSVLVIRLLVAAASLWCMGRYGVPVPRRVVPWLALIPAAALLWTIATILFAPARRLQRVRLRWLPGALALSGPLVIFLALAAGVCALWECHRLARVHVSALIPGDVRAELGPFWDWTRVAATFGAAGILLPPLLRLRQVELHRRDEVR